MNTSFLPIFLSVGLLCACDLAPGNEDSSTGASSTTGADTGDEPDDDDDDDDDDADDTGGDDDDDDADDTGGDDDSGEPPTIDSPSCEGLTTQCAGESCCTKIAVPGGPMQLGRGETGNDACPASGEVACSGWELPEHDVTVDGFVLDKYPGHRGALPPVRRRVGQRELASRAPATAPIPSIDGSGWDASWSDLLPGALTDGLFCQSWTQWSDEPGNKEDFPIGCVNWYHAQAFCIWDGGRLPTEAEFEFAAAGGDEDRLYPWGGATPDETRAVFYSANFVTASVGTTPDGAGRWGHQDLAGNLAEWSFDCYAEDFYESSEAGGDNPVNLPRVRPDAVPGQSRVGRHPHPAQQRGRGPRRPSFGFT